MTRKQAKSELEAIYMSLSEEKKKALDVAFKAMEQADGEKTCGTCRNEDTYHCAECENKSDWEQAQTDGEYISKDGFLISKKYDSKLLYEDTDRFINKEEVLWLLAEKVGYPFYTDIYEAVDELPSVAIPTDIEQAYMKGREDGVNDFIKKSLIDE